MGTPWNPWNHLIPILGNLHMGMGHNPGTLVNTEKNGKRM